jgi:carbonic anhydrase
MGYRSYKEFKRGGPASHSWPGPAGENIVEHLVRGVHYFCDIGFRQRQELFKRLKDGQHPEACFITCADSRIDPNLITNSEPGQLFIIRNVGNIVPCYGTANNGELAAVEYAVIALGVQDIIICGHTGCGAMKALLNPPPPTEIVALPNVRHWLSHANATLEIVREHYLHLNEEAQVKVAAEENVLVQLEHLRTLPCIAARVSSGKLRLHGWMYKIETGEVFMYDSDVGQFVSMQESEVASVKSVDVGLSRDRSSETAPSSGEVN